MEQQDALRSFSEFILQLESAERLASTIHSENNETKSFRDDLSQQLRQTINQAKEDAHYALDEIPWDHLVIALFGETNAGKSTIIETARILFEQDRTEGRDGLIVGDGRCDFTKDYHHYNLEICGRPFTLIDVPGIEGCEKEYTEGIKDALKFAHIVFYVQDGGKKPDVAVANNIKKYLSDWVDVYVIQNVRGGVSTYDMEEDRVDLLAGKQGESVTKVTKQISAVFGKLLGRNFKGVLPVQGLLAMCAQASFDVSREKDLGKQQKKLLEYFGSSNRMYDFSKYETIVSLIREKSNDFIGEIARSTMNKIISLAIRTNRNMNSLLSQHKSQLDNLESQLNQFRRDVEGICHDTENSIRRSLCQIVRDEFCILKIKIYEIIDQYSSDCEDEIQSLSNSLSKSICGKTKDCVRERLKQMTDRIVQKQKALQGIYAYEHQDIHVKLQNELLDCSGVPVELSFNLNDIGDFAMSTAGLAATGLAIGSVVPGVGSAIGAFVGGCIGFFGKLLTLGNRRKSKIAAAKKEVDEAVDEAKKATIKELDDTMQPLYNKIINNSKKMQDDIRDEIRKINQLKEIVARVQNEINQIIIINS